MFGASSDPSPRPLSHWRQGNWGHRETPLEVLAFAKAEFQETLIARESDFPKNRDPSNVSISRSLTVNKLVKGRSVHDATFSDSLKKIVAPFPSLLTYINYEISSSRYLSGGGEKNVVMSWG